MFCFFWAFFGGHVEFLCKMQKKKKKQKKQPKKKQPTFMSEILQDRVIFGGHLEFLRKDQNAFIVETVQDRELF